MQVPPGQVITFVILGIVGAIGLMALIALLVSRKNVSNKAPVKSNQERMDQALAMRRRRLFLEAYPEWQGRDFEGDRTSPWHTDPKFAKPL